MPAFQARIRGAPAIAYLTVTCTKCVRCTARGARRASGAHMGHTSAPMPPRRGAYTAMSISAALRGMGNTRYALATTAGAIVPSRRERTSLRCAPVA